MIDFQTLKSITMSIGNILIKQRHLTALRNIMTTQMFSRSTKTKYFSKLCERTMLRSFFIFPITICPIGQYHRNRKYNSQNMISQLQLLNEVLFKVNAQTDETMTHEQMKWHLENQQTIYDQLLEQGKEIQERTSQNVTAKISKLDQSAKELVSQAGKLNEEYGLKLKELDEYKHRLRSKAVKWIVISRSVLIALSVALQLWLR